jgi:hypothetical protein
LGLGVAPTRFRIRDRHLQGAQAVFLVFGFYGVLGFGFGVILIILTIWGLGLEVLGLGLKI